MFEPKKSESKFEPIFSRFLAFTDCTDQQIPRPVDKRRKKNFYSGIKTQLMVNCSTSRHS